MIKEPQYSVSGGSSLQAITLLSLVAIGLVEVNIFIGHVNSRTHVIEGVCCFVVGHVTSNHKPPFCQV